MKPQPKNWNHMMKVDTGMLIENVEKLFNVQHFHEFFNESSSAYQYLLLSYNFGLRIHAGTS